MSCSKVAFPSKREAKLRLLELRSIRRRQCAYKAENHAYRCPHCNQWHLTSKLKNLGYDAAGDLVVMRA